MNTEITETIQGYVFYDAACPLCRGGIQRLYDLLVRRGLHPVPLQAAWVRARLGLAEGEPLVEMKLLTREGTIYGGADALAQIARAIWWAWPLFALTQIPGVKALVREMYLRLAAHRPCGNGHCRALAQHMKQHRRTLSTFYEIP